MELILGVIVVTMLMGKAVSNAKLDHTYAKRGDVSPRLKAKYGTAAEARRKVGKYGFHNHLRDAWNDYWPRRTDALLAARNARPVDGKRVRLRDRIRAGKNAVNDQQPTTTPIPPATTKPTRSTAPDAPQPAPRSVLIPTDPAIDDPPDAGADPATEPATPVVAPDATPQPAAPEPTHGGNTMTAPTGEAVNYETTEAEIAAQITEVQRRIDADKAALAAMAEVKTAVDVVQQGYQNAATAAQTKLDHLSAMNLDGTTLGHAGTTVDAMPPNAVDGLYDQTEMVEQMIRERLQQDEIALASLEAERAHLVSTYGDAHATVAGNLGGNAEFLHSGGGGASGSGYTTKTIVDQKIHDTAGSDHFTDITTMPGSQWTDGAGQPV